MAVMKWEVSALVAEMAEKERRRLKINMIYKKIKKINF
jgi:hypothetical protein